MTAAELRHSLRTPLNHIIGFSEMLLEEAPEDAATAPLFCRLRDVARELAGAIQDAPLQGTGDVGATEMNQLRGRLLDPSLALREAAMKLGEGADVGVIRTAIDQLAAFAEDRPGSLERLTQVTSGIPTASGEAVPTVFHESGGHLLIVDDNAANREILSRHLERQSFRVSCAKDGRECLGMLLGAGAFDLVLLDVLMPVMDGFEVLRQMRLTPALRETPVIMISALDETAAVVRCIQMGAEDYLMKPFDPVLLGARIGASLEKKRLRSEQRRRTEELQLALDELKRTQAQLLVQEKLASLGAMTAGIAHEIRNPLNFITNFAAASVETVRDIRETHGELELLNQLEQYVLKIEEHGKRADRIVRSMLLHSRGKSGNPEPVDVNRLLSDCVNLAYHGLRAQNGHFSVRIDIAPDPADPLVFGIPQELSRVFLNIVNNACYAAWERREKNAETFEPRVTVTTTATETMVEIRIRDNGAGIPADILPRIFEPFFTTKPAGAGTGLGLSLSYDIVVHRHHGMLKVESRAGEGSEFIICLPGAVPQRSV